MPKYLLLKHYRGGPEPHRSVPPMDEWAPEDVEAHMAFLRHVTELLQANGEYVDAQASRRPARGYGTAGRTRRPSPRTARCLRRATSSPAGT